MKRKLLFAMLCIVSVLGMRAETDYTSLMSTDWTGSSGNFGGGKERYQGSNYGAGKIMYQSFTAPATGIYEIKFYAVTSCTADRYAGAKYGENIAQAYATAGSNKATVAMTVINQTGCTLVEAANIRTLSVEASEGETIEYGIENISEGGNWYTIKELSAKMKTVAEIFQAQYDEAYAIWVNSTENETGARATFKTYVDAMNTALSGTLADAQTASDNLAAALVTYESKSYPVKGSGVKYDFTSKMNMAIDAWTCVQGNGPAQYGFTGATETYGNTAVGDVMYQTISGLANGEYEIHFYAVANAANGGGVEGTKTTVYANDVEEEINVITQSSCTPSEYERTLTVMVKDGTLKYGIKNTVAAGNWYICKNVALYMTGAPDLSDYYDAIAGKLTIANGLKSSPMKATVLTALQDAIDATDGYTDITVIGTLETLSDDLTTAINNANTSIANYDAALTILNAASTLDAAGQALYAANTTVAELQTAYNNRTLDAVTSAQETESAAVISNYNAWTTLKAQADALVAVANDNSSANSTLSSAISDQATAVSEATTAAAIATATSTLKTAMVTYAGAANPVGDGVKFDLTFMLTNPDVTDFWTGDDNGGYNNDPNDHRAWGVAPNGWYTDQEGGNFQVMTNSGMADGGEVFMEYWSVAASTSGFVLYQKATLPEGTYRMTGRVGLNQDTGGANANMTFSANETDGSQVAVGNLSDQEVEFVNTSEQEVKIGIKAQTGNTYRWIGINKIKLYKIPAAATVVLNENSLYVEAATAADVELTRTIFEGWNTVVLPFSMTADEITDVFGEGQLYSFTGADAGVLNFSTATNLVPHTPYLFNANAARSVSGVTIPARTIGVSTNSLTTAGADYNFVGTYTPYAQGESPIVAGADYVLGDDAAFHLTSTKNAIKAFRAYIKANEPDGNVRALRINLDGEETAIESIDNNVLTTGAIYNVAGQRVSKAQKGLYIVNGKKVVIK